MTLPSHHHASRRVAVLGAGIMGSSVALFLARRGIQVTLIDGASEPFSGASRWNEGKIHLGYLYAGDPTLATARNVLRGGLTFRGLTEELIGCSLEEAITPHDDIYLIHRDSVATPEATAGYFEQVTQQARTDPNASGYLADVSHSHVHRLAQTELEEIANTDAIVAGFQVPERSVLTNWIANRFVGALAAEPRIELRLDTRVTGIRPSPKAAGRWLIESDHPIDGDFDVVVNALWHGRLAIDRAAGLEPEPGWSHRYRLSLFIHTATSVAAPSAVVATGPFGDIKNYTGREFYLSWYEAGLLARGESVLPPRLPVLDEDAERKVASATIERLARHIPTAGEVAANAVEMKVRGGWVFAAGRGSLADPHATLHRRDAFGIRQRGTYISVDTGKYSSAPFLAREIANRISGIATG